MREAEKETQKGIILAHLQANGSITGAEGIYTYGITRVAARIKDLERDGFCFHRVREQRLDERGKEIGHHTRYFLLPVFEGRQEQ